jgi:DnaJ-class molecular chaperone
MKECDKCHGTGYVIVILDTGYSRFRRKKCPQCDGKGIILEFMSRRD